jgi:hypothetical protein
VVLAVLSFTNTDYSTSCESAVALLPDASFANMVFDQSVPYDWRCTCGAQALWWVGAYSQSKRHALLKVFCEESKTRALDEQRNELQICSEVALYANIPFH